MDLINFDRIHWQLKVKYGATTELVNNIIGTGLGDFPLQAVRVGKCIVAEYVRSIISADKEGIREKLLAFVKSQGGKEEGSLFLSRLKTDRYNASLYNGALGRLSDCDPSEDYLHYASIVVPAALSVAEKEMKEGRRILESVILGVETMLRLKDAARTVPYDRSLDPTSTFGPFGSAVAAAKMLGYDADSFEDTLSLCPSQSAGAFRSSYYGDGESGYITSGFAASYGIRCAYLARNGLSGPRGIIEGNMGYLECISGLHDDFRTPRYDLDSINMDWGVRWRICRLEHDDVRDILNGCSYPRMNIKQIISIIENLEELEDVYSLIRLLMEEAE